MTLNETRRRLPLYAQVKEDLIGEIDRGELARGDQLPSQRTLCEEYGASHMTVRRAISELINEGVLYSIPGKGVYVAEHKEQAESGPLVSFTEDMALRGMKASSRVLASELIQAPTTLAERMSVAEGTELVYLRRLRLADSEPMAIQACYLVHSLCPGLLEHDLESNSLFEILRDVYGLDLADSEVSVEAELADAERADLLGIASPAPLLITEQITHLDSGETVEFVRSAYRGDRYRMQSQ